MELVVLVSGLLMIVGFFLVMQLRSSRRKAEAELQLFATTVTAPLTDDVRRWLRPQLARRADYQAIGSAFGVVAANIPLTSDWYELPWYWFAFAAWTGVGFVAGALVAGYRTTPLVDGPVRTVDPARRRVSDHFGRHQVLQLRVAIAVSTVALVVALAGGFATTGDTAVTTRALLGCALAAILVAAHYAVAATVIARPMVASTPEGLQWHKALVTRTLEHVPQSALIVAILSASVAAVATSTTL